MSDVPAVAMLIGGVVLLLLWGFWRGDTMIVTLSQRIRGQEALIDAVFRLFSWTPFVVTVLFVLPSAVLLAGAHYRELAAVFVSCSLALGCAFLGKFMIGRTRPLNHLTYIGKRDSSFPSAHTAGSFAAALSMAVFVPQLLYTVLVLAGVVAVSRLYLQMHFLSDVAGGLLVAYVAVLFVMRTDFLDFFLSFLPIA